MTTTVDISPNVAQFIDPLKNTLLYYIFPAVLGLIVTVLAVGVLIAWACRAMRIDRQWHSAGDKVAGGDGDEWVSGGWH